jgi:hypothetical protein
MKRFRLSTLMLLVVIAGLGIALVKERERSARLEQRTPIYKLSQGSISRLKLKVEQIALTKPKEGGNP